MRIVDLLKKEAVVLNAEVSTKEQMLDLLVDLHKEEIGWFPVKCLAIYTTWYCDCCDTRVDNRFIF